MDLISRAEAIDGKILIQRVNGVEIYSDEAVPVEYLKRLPSAQSERKTGRWVSVGCVVPSITNVPMIKCTVCGHLEPDVDAARTPYCSHCGAYMKGGEDD